MHYKNKIYDITALEIFKRLEVFFTRVGVPSGKQSLDDKISQFKKLPRFAGHTAKVNSAAQLMRAINDKRNEIVHPPDMDIWTGSSIEPIVALKKRAKFKEFRDKCLKLEQLLSKPPFIKHIGMSEIMIPTLKYGMGNLGDIIKHGLLAEFAEWHKLPMIVADTFAGCPWGGNSRISNRMKKLEEASNGNVALIRAYPKKQGTELKDFRLYFGSSHLMHRIGENLGKEITVLMSDNDEDARNNLRASLHTPRPASRMQVIPLSADDNGKNNDGYAILNDDDFNKYKPDLILLDPYGKFLREEYHSEGTRLEKIATLTKANPSLWIVLFVLDMHPENDKQKSRQTVQETHDFYTEHRNKLFRNKAVYLHCPKAKKPFIEGEENYDVEVLLISEQLKSKSTPNIKELLTRLRIFAKTATNALANEPKLTLTGEKKVEYREV